MSSTAQSLSFAAPLALLWFGQVATPGPNFVRISHAALTMSRSAALATATGTAIGNALWCTVAAAGAASILKEGGVGLAIRLFGIGYFLWLGIALLARALKSETLSPEFLARDLSNSSKLMAVRAGLATALSNPQAALFFTTYFVSTMPVDATPAAFAAAIILVATVTLGWYLFVVSVLVQPKARDLYLRVRPVIDASFGVLVLITAYRLAVSL